MAPLAEGGGSRGPNLTVEVYVMGGTQRSHRVRRLGTPRRSRDAVRRTASPMRNVYTFESGEGE